MTFEEVKNILTQTLPNAQVGERDHNVFAVKLFGPNGGDWDFKLWWNDDLAGIWDYVLEVHDDLQNSQALLKDHLKVFHLQMVINELDDNLKSPASLDVMMSVKDCLDDLSAELQTDRDRVEKCVEQDSDSILAQMKILVESFRQCVRDVQIARFDKYRYAVLRDNDYTEQNDLNYWDCRELPEIYPNSIIFSETPVIIGVDTGFAEDHFENGYLRQSWYDPADYPDDQEPYIGWAYNLFGRVLNKHERNLSEEEAKELYELVTAQKSGDEMARALTILTGTSYKWMLVGGSCPRDWAMHYYPTDIYTQEGAEEAGYILFNDGDAYKVFEWLGDEWSEGSWQMVYGWGGDKALAEFLGCEEKEILFIDDESELDEVA